MKTLPVCLGTTCLALLALAPTACGNTFTSNLFGEATSTGSTGSGTGGSAASVGASTGATSVGSGATTSSTGATTSSTGTASGTGGATSTGSSAGSGGSGPCQTAPGACVAALPSGWKLAAFEKTHAAACPAGFAAHDVVADPIAGVGACDCSCSLASLPSCSTGDMPTYYSNDGSCGMKGLTIHPNGGCTSLGGTGALAAHFAATPPAAVAACTTDIVLDLSKVTTAPMRLCDAPSACEEDICQGAVAAGFAACIYVDGDVACPAAFANRIAVGNDASLSCSACKDCTASADCANPQIEFFADGACSKPVVTLAADGTCVSTKPGGYVGSFVFTATAANQACTATGPKTPSVALSSPRTVCCK